MGTDRRMVAIACQGGPAGAMDWRTKLNRDPTLIRELLERGQATGAAFMAENEGAG